jgi:hypothetical protein
MIANKPVYIGLAIHVSSKEWGFDDSTSAPIIFELFQPDFLLELGNNNLDYITVADYPNSKIPFKADVWNYVVMEFFANTVTPSASYVSVWGVEPTKGNWLNPIATQYVNLQGYKFNTTKGTTWTFNWGIYRGKKKVAQTIKYGQINIGDTMSAAMPQP